MAVAFLDGKAVVVTGAGRGIGAEYAKAAAAEGARVVVNDIDGDVAEEVAAQIGGSGGTAVAVQADVSDWAAADAMVEVCVREFGSVDGIVNNAGLFDMSLPGELDEEQMRRLLDANVMGVAASATAAMRRMAAQGFGSIVNVVSGAHFGIPYMAAYSATKGAVASLTYTWSLELSDRGVRVNAISPLGRSRMGETTGAFFERAQLGRIDSQGSPAPEANAPLAVFLLSDRSSAITGQIIRIEGSHLSLVAHPVVLDPVMSTEGFWTPQGISDAFETELGKRLVPVGMKPLLRAEYLSGGSAFWDGRATPDA
jgi:NAD(P)-dependent dehydrogenase (short-subunit alcohol dehydrogenase family)